MNKKRRVKRGKIALLCFIVLIIVCCVLFFSNRKKKNNPTRNVEIVDSIDNFDYQLNDNKTKYYNGLFNSLKSLLSKDDYDEEEYAVLISKLFLADFYDLDNKVMKSDIGGTQFVYSDYREDFEKGAIDTVYKSVESNVYGDRKQSLPIVKNIESTSVTSDSFEYGDSIDYKAYFVRLNVSYEKDLGYPTDISLVLIHNNDKLEIAKMEAM